MDNITTIELAMIIALSMFIVGIGYYFIDDKEFL